MDFKYCLHKINLSLIFSMNLLNYLCMYTCHIISTDPGIPWVPNSFRGTSQDTQPQKKILYLAFHTLKVIPSPSRGRPRNMVSLISMGLEQREQGLNTGNRCNGGHWTSTPGIGGEGKDRKNCRANTVFWCRSGDHRCWGWSGTQPWRLCVSRGAQFWCGRWIAMAAAYVGGSGHILNRQLRERCLRQALWRTRPQGQEIAASHWNSTPFRWGVPSSSRLCGFFPNPSRPRTKGLADMHWARCLHAPGILVHSPPSLTRGLMCIFSPNHAVSPP